MIVCNHLWDFLRDFLRPSRKRGNIFLTNIHRVYEGATESASFDDADTTDYFLGKKPTGATNDSKLDLGDIVRNVDELCDRCPARVPGACRGLKRCRA